MKSERIIRRVKGLLKLADDNSNVEESHSAFLQAQAMMVKYGVNPSEVTDNDEIKEVLEKSGTEYKRLYWYERELAYIVAKNFRCKYFMRGEYVTGKAQIQRKIMFMGLNQDAELATEMYRLVISAIEFYTHKYIKEHGIGIRQHTQQLKNDYMIGFIDGLERKFEEQIQVQEWGLVLATPKEVEEKYDDLVAGKLNHNVPQLASQKTYQQGFKDGNAIDYKKETIKE